MIAGAPCLINVFRSGGSRNQGQAIQSNLTWVTFTYVPANIVVIQQEITFGRLFEATLFTPFQHGGHIVDNCLDILVLKLKVFLSYRNLHFFVKSSYTFQRFYRVEDIFIQE